ncbi:site-specific integrase [Acetobacter estunensis]|nr:site-specific integrase [Acetobacter estunensis]MBV1836125.1 site-specific integrase [Acetobacter estunensis]
MLSCRQEYTVGEALERYIKVRMGKVEALTRLQEASIPLHEGLGHLRVDQVGQDRWDEYAATRYRKRNPRSAPDKPHELVRVADGTLRREFNVLRAALRQAWKDGRLAKPPALTAPRDSAPRDRYLTKGEARKLLEAAETPHVKVFVAVAMFTGARKGSILSLTWDRVNFQTGMIDFQEPGRHLTAKRRSIVPMTNRLREILEEAFRMRECDYVIQFNGRPVPCGLRWSFKKLCERAGLSWTPTPHHLKHSIASWFAMDKVPIDQAADWLATDPQTLRKVYRKFDPEYLKGVASSLNF